MTELEWLTERRPETAADEEAAARARAALLAHATRGGNEAAGRGAPLGESARGRAAKGRAARARGRAAGAGGRAAGARGRAAGSRGRAARPLSRAAGSRGRAPVGPGRAVRSSRRPADLWPRGKAGLYALAAAAFAVAIVIAAGSLPSGDGPGRIAAPEPAAAAPLVRLSERIEAEPAPRGDATLVLRRHTFPDDRGFTGADLYLDDGRYFYATTRAELRGAAPQEEFGQRQIAAAKAAIDLPAAKARERMIATTWAPDGEPAVQAPRKKRPAAKGPTPTPAPQIVIDNNRVWMGSMDALIAGAGRADVRAGVMKLLATISKVGVERGDGVLNIRNADFPDGYVETLVVDDETGMLRTMIGGDAGQKPSVVVEYEITRVIARDVLK